VASVVRTPGAARGAVAMMVHRYRAFPTERDPIIEALLMRGARFARDWTAIHQRRKELSAMRRAVAGAVDKEQAAQLFLRDKAEIKALQHDARAHSGLYYPTYNAIAAMRDKAAKNTGRRCLVATAPGTCRCGAEHPADALIWVKKGVTIGCPACKRGLPMPFGDVTVIGGQIMGGCTVAEALAGTSAQLRITGEGEWRYIHRRIAPLDVTEGAWLVVKFHDHKDEDRKLPLGATITDARFVRHTLGEKHKWYVILALDCAAAPRPAPTRGVVGINFGWRQMDNGDLRVAVWRDDAGRRGEVRIPHALVRRFRYVDTLESIQGKNLEALRTRVCAMREESFVRLEATAHGLRDATKSMHLWRSPQRFVALANQIDRASGVEREIQTWWRRREGHVTRGHQHLQRWIDNQRARCPLQRRALFQAAARELAEYREVHIDNTNFASLARVAEDPDDRLAAAARRNRVIAAPGKLREAIISTVGRAGGAIVWKEALYVTATCPTCGHRGANDPKQLIHTCEKCSAVWDQDDKAAENVRVRAAPVPPPPDTHSQTEAPVAVGKGAWARAKAAKKAREARERSQGDT
jgi:hypothetical protein